MRYHTIYKTLFHIKMKAKYDVYFFLNHHSNYQRYSIRIGNKYLIYHI
jgi:hypothetical protein